MSRLLTQAQCLLFVISIYVTILSENITIIYMNPMYKPFTLRACSTSNNKKIKVLGIYDFCISL